MGNGIKAIIFGSNGQDGYYLRKVLAQEGIECRGISRTGDAVHGDVADYGFVEKQIAEYQPTYIFHFAANSTTRHRALFENHQTISTGTVNILESVKIHSPNSKVFISGSAMQFRNGGLPIDEQTPFEASSPYAVSRIHSVYAARYYREKFGMKTYVGYFFNHDSPLRTEQHVNQFVINAVKRIHAGSADKLEIGNINVKKEFSFAGDIVNAVWMLVQQEAVFEVVIGSGVPYSLKEWIEYCFDRVDKKWNDYVISKTGFVGEYDILVSKPDLIKSLGWTPKVNMHQLADMMLDQ